MKLITSIPSLEEDKLCQKTQLIDAMPANTRRMALTNNATEVVTKPDDSEEIEEREEMIAKADELISSLAMRKNGVTSLLEGMVMDDWGVIKNHSVCPDESGIIPTNTVLRRGS